METFLIVKRKDEAQSGEYRAKRLILGYYEAYPTGGLVALQAWLGPEQEREPQVYEDRSPSSG